MCDSRTRKLTHRPGKIPFRKHVNLEKVKKSACFLFSPVKIWSTLFFEVSLSFSTKSPSLSNSWPPGNFQKSNPDPRATFKSQIPTPGQLSKVKSRPPGRIFKLIPGGCPGGCTQLELTETCGFLCHKYFR